MKQIKKINYLWLAILLVGLLGACGDEEIVEGALTSGTQGQAGNIIGSSSPSAGNTDNRSPQARFSMVPNTIPRRDNYTTVVTLDASPFNRPADGDPIDYLWEVSEARYVEGTNNRSKIAKVTFEGTANYGVTLTVTDPDGLSASAGNTVLSQ